VRVRAAILDLETGVLTSDLGLAEIFRRMLDELGSQLVRAAF
jgi:hypothetical protein